MALVAAAMALGLNTVAPSVLGGAPQPDGTPLRGNGNLLATGLDSPSWES